MKTVVEEVALRTVFLRVLPSYPINNMLLLPAEQHTEICVPSENRTFRYVRKLDRKKVHLVFLSITLIFYLLTCTDSSRTTRQTAKIVKILIMVLRCVVLWCGVCLNKI